MRKLSFFKAMLAVALAASVTGTSVGQLQKMDLAIEKARNSYYSLQFISESFRKTCKGEGFNSFEEWEQTCSALWQLSEISYETDSDGLLICGSWSGPWGNGVVYCNKGESK